jgi:hypothetical protein
MARAIWTRVRLLGDQRWTRWIITGLILVLSAVGLGGMLVAYWPTLIAYRWELRPLPLVVAYVVYSLDLPLAVWGWSIIMGRLAGSIGLREHFRVYCSTLVAGRIPGAPWHIAGRAVLYKQLGVSRRVTGSASAIEMLLIIVSGLLSGCLTWPFLPESAKSQLIWFAPVVPIGLGLMHPTVIQAILKRLIQNETPIRLRYSDTLELLGLYLLVWGLGGVVLYAVIRALYPLPVTMLPGVVGVWGLAGAVASLVFFSPTGLGVKEITLSLLLALFIPAGLAVVTAILMRLFLTAAEFSWAIIASRL